LAAASVETRRRRAAAAVGAIRRVVARGLHRDASDRLVLACEPGVEAVEAGTVLADAQDLAVGLVHAFVAAGHRVLSSPDIDADGDHRMPPLLDTQGCPHHPVDVS
jgi:hypothetical protein